MRKILSFLMLISCMGAVRAQMHANVDPRFELTSIAFRLAGAREYAQCGVPAYAQDIDDHFLQYAVHPLISFIQQIRRDYGIGYNAVSDTADWLLIEGGRVSLDPAYDAAEVSKADSRWTAPVFRRYLALLDDFYRESDFQRFYDAHRGLYDYAQRQLDSLLVQVDTGWFERFYGTSFGDPDIYIGMCNGPSNYALTADGRHSGYGIVVGCGSDREGRPAYTPLFLQIVLHEFAHNYSNPLAKAFWPQMEEAGKLIFPHVAEQMTQAAYGDPETMTGEWFNELCVLMAFREMQPKWLSSLIANDEQRGYLWMGNAVAFMEEFYADRERYPHIGDFMPRIVEFYNDTAANIVLIAEELRQRTPQVVEVIPATGSTVSADALPSEVVVRFSEPMRGGYGANSVERSDVIDFPLDGVCYWRDEYTLVYPLKPDELERSKTYGLMLLGWAFVSTKGYSMEGYYDLTFTVE